MGAEALIRNGIGSVADSTAVHSGEYGRNQWVTTRME